MGPIDIGYVVEEKYKILREIAHGGMGDIYEALQLNISRRVALKVLHPRYVESKEMVQRFVNEARAANRIHHPAVVHISERGTLPDQRMYLVMEYLMGEDLGRRMRATGRKRSEAEVLHWGWAIADVMAAAHAAGVIHRDLKPSNIMLVPDDETKSGERVRLLDFGIAKLLDSAEGLTGAAQVLGSVHYMAPEQWARSRSVNDKADVYSLGVMLFEMLAGQLPLGHDRIKPLEMGQLHLQQEPLELSQLAPHVTPGLCQLVQCMLAKPRKYRPAMSEVAEQLRIFGGVFASRAGKLAQAGRQPNLSAGADAQTIGLDSPTIPDGETPAGSQDGVDPALDEGATKILNR